ncbi:MAG: LLM class flavin-dependent oxidoreductase [Gaiellales bacterium]
MLSFGLMPDTGPKIGEWAAFAEERGFRYFWILDSPVNWREMSPYLTLAVTSTRDTIIGACVSNPVTRNIAVNASLHATLQELSGGRIVLGLGKGDSAVRRLGERPAKLRELKERAPVMQALASGEMIEYTPETPADESWHAQGAGDQTLELPWAPKQHMPLYIAGYGPKVLHWSGQAADGIFMQIAEPETIEWALGHLRAGAETVGRDVGDIEVVVCTPSIIDDDLSAACDVARGFPAFVSNHVTDMLRYYDPAELPANLLRCVEQKSTYDYRHHTESDTDHAAAIPDDVVDSFTIVGSVERCAAKLQRLAELGVTQLCIYFMGIAEEDMKSTIRLYADEVIPAVRSKTGSAAGA